MKKTLFILFSIFVILGGFAACSDKDEDETKELILTIASIKRSSIGEVIDGDFYFAKEANETRWYSLPYIVGFEHEEGYEYVLKVKYEKWHDGEIMDAPTHRYVLIEVISKTKKESQDIPLVITIITIASKRPDNTTTPAYYIQRLNGDWAIFENEIEKFEYEEGYEYTLIIGKAFMGHNAQPQFTYHLIETREKEQKESIGLPK